jgi:hypothetical protein
MSDRSSATYIAVYTMLGNVRSVGLRGAALMIDSDRTTHLLRICAGQDSPTSRSPGRAQRPRLSVKIGTGRLLLMIAPEPCVVRQPRVCESYLAGWLLTSLWRGVWGSGTSALMLFGIWSRGVAVLVDHTTEDPRPPNGASRAGSLSLAAVDRRALLESTVRAVSVVVGLVLRQHTCTSWRS